MSGGLKILLLAGTAEAQVLAKGLAHVGHQVVASLAGVTRAPTPLAVATRSGGFGGRQAQADYMRSEGFDVLVDATHPFAEKITHRSHEICKEMALPYLRLSRPAWVPAPGEIWHHIATVDELSALIPLDEKVFLATGAQSSDIAQALPGRVLFCRRIEAGPEPFALSGGWIIGRPPFSVDAEVALFQQLETTWIVAKNAGGPARAKLAAAQELGLSVAMIDRPQGPDAPTVDSVNAALDWVLDLTVRQNG